MHRALWPSPAGEDIARRARATRAQRLATLRGLLDCVMCAAIAHPMNDGADEIRSIRACSGSTGQRGSAVQRAPPPPQASRSQSQGMLVDQAVTATGLLPVNLRSCTARLVALTVFFEIAHDPSIALR